ncbi:MAG: acyltransferase [Planctomycetota bacterium]|nr:MAG: acyltransferase [Planctomycetota bacterium]
MKQPHLIAMESFRGLAILLIITGHVIGLVPLHIDSTLEKLPLNLLMGGTSLFVFISGFLFYYLYPETFDFIRFLRQKISFVLLPYLVMSALPVTYYAAKRADWTPLHGATGLWALWEPLLGFLVQSLAFLSNGSHIPGGYWYVPFIMVIFVLSPPFRVYGRLRLAPRLAIMVFSMAISMLIHRPVENLLVAQSVIYYTPVYLLGINVAINREEVLRRLAGREGWLGIGILGLAFAQAVCFTEYGNLHKPALQWGGIDLMLPQKMLVCLLLYSLFSRVSCLNQPILKTLATSSFALFFLHPLLIIVLHKVVSADTSSTPFGTPIEVIQVAVWAIVVTGLSYAIASAIRWCLPAVSRRIIGW